jgi:preprotein translocase subunit SecD
LGLQDPTAPSEAWDMTWQRRQLPEDTTAAPKQSPHRRQWWIAVLVLALTCNRAGGAAPPASVSPSTTESSSDSVAPAQRANLQMRQVIQIVVQTSADWRTTRLTCSGQGDALNECVASALDVDRIILLRPEESEKYVLGPVIVDETDVVRATAQLEQQADLGWSISIELTADAAEAFQAATEAAVGSPDPQNQIAIIVEGRIVSSPTVAEPIRNGSLVLTGRFTETQARLLASNLSGSG